MLYSDSNPAMGVLRNPTLALPLARQSRRLRPYDNSTIQRQRKPAPRHQKTEHKKSRHATNRRDATDGLGMNLVTR